VTEVPIHFHERDAGVSKMPRLEILRGVANLLYHIVHRRPFAPFAADVGGLPDVADAPSLVSGQCRKDASAA
jgi:hypothetical protein